MKRGDGPVGLIGIAAAACVACCAGPLLVFLGGLTIAGVAGTVFVGTGALILAAAAALAFVIVRRRQRRSACHDPGSEPILMPAPTRRRPPKPARVPTAAGTLDR